MLEKYLPAIGVIGLVLLIGGYFLVVAPREAAKKDAMTFSSTQVWDPDHLALAEGTTTHPSDMFASIILPPPPKNSSTETAQELVTLHGFEAKRTPEIQNRILADKKFDAADFGGYAIATYEDASVFPKTAALLEGVTGDIDVVEMQLKKKFDRVRPSVLDPTLSTVSKVSAFPSYPDCTTAESFFLAYVFGELAPARKDEFLARADQLGLNKLYSGIQFPSDMEEGKVLGKQFFDIFMKDPVFQKNLVAAKTEWSAKGLITPRAEPI